MVHLCINVEIKKDLKWCWVGFYGGKIQKAFMFYRSKSQEIRRGDFDNVGCVLRIALSDESAASMISRALLPFKCCVEILRLNNALAKTHNINVAHNHQNE